MNTFAESGLSKELLKAVAEIGFVTPTPIQQEAIPHLLDTERDLIAFAQTGTGKTAAFGLPCLHKTNSDDHTVQTIILCPTRELCIQITKDLQSYSKYMSGLRVTPVYGGSSIDTQIRALKQGTQIVVGTPGRTLDLIKRRKLKLGNVSRVVLDEADEMLTMGFKEDLEAILAQTPDERQTMLFSATMSKEMKAVTKKYMRDPERITVAAMNKGAETVEHLYYMVHSRDRYDALKRIADLNPNIYGIIFCRTRRETKEVASKLMHDGYSADAIHGDLSQSQRDEVMGKFRTRALQLLVATDVFRNNSNRDAGITQSAIAHEGVLSMPISENVEAFATPSAQITSMAYNNTVIVSQTGRTTSMKVNPYMAFDPIPAEVTLNPAVDHAVRNIRDSWAPSIFTGSGNTSRLTRTEQVGQTVIEQFDLRQIPVAFTLEGFGPSETLAEVIFDGVDVTSTVVGV